MKSKSIFSDGRKNVSLTKWFIPIAIGMHQEKNKHIKLT